MTQPKVSIIEKSAGVYIVNTPYNSQFITRLKEAIDKDEREYDPETNNWIIKDSLLYNGESNIDMLMDLVTEYYPDAVVSC